MSNVISTRLEDIAGKQNVLSTAEDLIAYGYDAQHVEHRPDAVVRPANVGETAEIVSFAFEEGIPIIPRGAGTGLSGGSVAINGGIVLDMSRMNRILDIDRENLLATVETGVVTADLNAAVQAVGLLYPPDPGSMKVSTIGGNVAENAGGLLAIKYGVTTDYVKQIEGVTATGQPFHAGAQTLKSVSGYDLVSLLCGSEGTLAVFTKIVVKLLPMPKSRRSMLAPFADPESAARAVSGIISSGIMPATLEFMDNVTIRTVEDYKKLGLPVDAGALLLLEVDGARAQVEEEADICEIVLKRHGAMEVQTASSASQRDRIWEGRRAALASLARVRPTTILEDATVPRSKLAEMVHEVNRIAAEYKLQIGTFGHAGDGNLHPTILTDERNAEEMARVEKAVDEIFRVALSLGGTVSGEHGIGFTKARYLPMEMGEGSMEMMRAVKKALDPKGILNPGKMFTE